MSTKPRLLIPREIHDALFAQARNEAPNECCGLLAGPMPRDGDYVVAGRFPLVNALASPTAFESEPHGLLAVHRQMRERGWEILAVYHSHPATPAMPSARDREMTFAENVATLIVSLADDEVRGWWINNDEILSATIDIV